MQDLLSRPFQAVKVWAILGVFLGIGQLQAQVTNGNQWPKARLNLLTPPGGKIGTTFEVTFTGTDLDDPQSLYFSHPGIKAVPVIPPPPKVDPKAKPDPKKKVVHAPITKFSVTINKDVPVGYYDVRFVGQHGISNPRVFVVGDLEEVAEKEPNNDVDQVQKVAIGTTINGAISAPTDVDYSGFTGKKGQHVLISCLSASIDSRLHPELELIDSSGRKIASHRPAPDRDGLMETVLPADGDYVIRLVNFTYTLGGPEYFYRLTISQAPWIDSVFPPMIEPGKTAQVTLFGRNLPGGKPDPSAILDGQVLEKLVVSITAPADPMAAQRLAYSGLVSPVGMALDGFEYRLQTPAGVSNPVLITYAKVPVVLENDNNDSPAAAQELPLPCEVAGRIDKKNDHDWYAIQCKKGDIYHIELLSHRLGAPTMMYIKIRNLAAKPPQDIVILDENPETINNRGLYSVTRDPPPYKFTAPADGKYHILVGSHLSNLADPTHVYRLRISKEMPDFRLIAMPSEDYRPDAGLVGQGGLEMYTVAAVRQDGFKGDIALTMEGLPPGVACVPQVLAGGMKFTHLVLSAADNAAPFTGAVKVIGTAVIGGQKVIREARPATITWATQANQNIPTVTRLDKALVLAVRDKAPGRLSAAPDKAVVTLGDKLNLNLKFQRLAPDFKGNFQVQAVQGDLAQGMTFGNLTFAPGKDEQKAVLAIAPNTAPGTYNVVFRGFGPMTSNSAKAKPVNTILPSNPVQVTVLPKQVANLSVDNANPNIKIGKDATILVRVARLFDYNDAFKVQLILPKEMKGVSADDFTIPAGANEAKLLLKVPADAMPGNRQNLIVRATAVLSGNVTLTHETKINVNVQK